MAFKFTSNTITKPIAILALALISSCASKKDIVYFQDEPVNDQTILNTKFELAYKTDDLLTIDVSALDPDAVRPFNLPAVTYNSGGLSAQGNVIRQTYLVDPDGNIEFPVLGTLKIGGLTRAQASDFLKEKLSEYVKNPIVNIRLINFTISVLGEVNRPGTFTIQDERISLVEALGLAGDLTIYGERNNVFLVREVDGQKKYAKFDLTSINVVNSPVYYLTQNDMIYVTPNDARVRQSSYNPNNSLIISAVGVLATITAILIK
ncbi:polysaccharide biosynthesis/export family protein [Ichthyenterobacterium magnum]|uniref:Polysaccharide export outer membrane protein n=1 Tax=Ichthyenterobacterium magnum TaxID=1230530 RepID=A0A420DLY0_9FLAO|nr:polysaccharide biosynthesis/export family protein [Ichthyenterobacterium magnum]RKE95296.1 polysaccharide export outer membrane protein [Ichthyenterobacterium magnum]